MVIQGVTSTESRAGVRYLSLPGEAAGWTLGKERPRRMGGLKVRHLRFATLSGKF